jgi:predicted nucleotidyltransferase
MVLDEMNDEVDRDIGLEEGRIARDERVNAKSDADQFIPVLEDVVRALHEIPFCVLGGVASAAYGRPRLTKDIDVFVRREDAERALAGLTEFGFETEHTNPSWIFKGFRDGVLVDVIFKVKSDVYFDDEMAARVRTAEYAGVEIPVLSPEDLVVTKAIAAEEEAPWHWYDALGVLAVNELDWEYLHERARKSPNRVLSLLHFAQSIDLPVPARAVRCLHDLIASRWD